MDKFNQLNQLQRSPESCSGLVSGGIYDCDNPLVSGIRKRVIIGSINKILTKTFDPADAMLMTDLAMQLGEQCYQFDGAKNSIQPSVELREGSIANTYGHILALSIFEVDSEQKLNIQGMVNDQMFAIIESVNDTALGNSVFEIYGLGGMEINELTRNPNDPDSSGAYVISMQTPEEYGGESRLAVSLDAGDHQLTLDLIDVLLAPAV